MASVVNIDCGFAEVGPGTWLVRRGQPAAFFGTALRRPRRGWFLRDRPHFDLIETSAAAKCADSARPFLTHIPCAAPVHAVSSKVLVAPASARTGASTVHTIPLSRRCSLCVTDFAEEWIVAATEGRTARVPLDDGQTCSARPEAVVAWTGRTPTGYCPKLRLVDILLPRAPRDLLLTFYGPGVLWIEGVAPRAGGVFASRRQAVQRRAHGF